MESQHEADAGSPTSERERKGRGGFVSRLLLWWVTVLLRTGYSRPLDEGDVYPHLLPEESTCAQLSIKLGREWVKELSRWRHGEKPSLLAALRRCYGRRVLAMGGLLLMQEVLRIGQAILLGELVGYLTSVNTTTTSTLAYVYAGTFCAAYFLITLLGHPVFHSNYVLGMKMRVACTALLYSKALKLSSYVLQTTSKESIIKLLAEEAQKLDQSVFAVNYLWLGPLSTIAACLLLFYWHPIGFSFLGGLLTSILLVLPVHIAMSKAMSHLRIKANLAANTRVKVINEVLHSMRSIKIYCLETTFRKIVKRLRSHELSKITSSLIGRAFSLAYLFFSSKLMTFATFSCLYLLGESFTVQQVCLTLALLDIIRLNMTIMLPLGLFYGSEALTTITSIQEFLLLEEKSHEVYSSWGSSLPEDVLIEFDDFSAFPSSAEKASVTSSLQKINFLVNKGHLVVIVGPPGSGKTPLLMAILGEIPRLRGFLRINGRLSYATQQPWVFQATVKDNILFGCDYDRSRYSKVIKSCDLTKDLDSFPQSDMTIVGDCGYELSYGQKTKINMARAIYRQADIYLLDDPFGAVDSSVGRTIFNKCVCGFLKDSTIVLVTQQLPYVRVADQVIVMQEGSITAKGTYDELLDRGVDFSALLSEFEVERTPTIEATLAATAELSKTKRHPFGSVQLSAESLNASLANVHVEHVEGKSMHSLLLSDKALPHKRGRGVPWSYYGSYVASAGGGGVVAAVVLLSVLAGAAYVVSDLWLVNWSHHLTLNESRPRIADLFGQQTADHLAASSFFYAYIAITASCVVCALAASFVFFSSAVRASRQLHESFFRWIVSAPLSELHHTSIGELLKRFSQDIVLVGDLLPVTMYDTWLNGTLIVITLLLNCAANHWLWISLLPLAVAVLSLRFYYERSARDVKKIEYELRYPLYDHMSTTLDGLWTVRALESGDRFLQTFETYQDKHTAAFYAYVGTNRWFALVVDVFCVAFVILIAIVAVVVAISGDTAQLMSPTMVSLGLVYACNLVWNVQSTVRNSVEVDCQMTAVESIMDYSKMKEEVSVVPPSENNSWPNYGIVTLEGVSVTYPDTGVKALRNIFCCFRAYEKVGVVGRSGAGKHSLVNAILRLYEPHGIVRIDGVDTATVNLTELRDKIAVIPEDSPVFSGTLRQNLDLAGKYSDAQLWKVLEEVNLKHRVEGLPGRLYADLNQLQPHFGIGQQRLLCLARVLLKSSPRLLIVEETLDTVDPRSAALLQKVIRRNFESCTVITIARRLKTVIDADRIMVLDNGRIKEFDPPHLLLQNEKSVLNQLVKQRGTLEANLLREIARHKYENRPYVPPFSADGGETEGLGVPSGGGGGVKSAGYYIPSFQSLRLTAAFNHLTSHKEANKFQRKF